MSGGYLVTSTCFFLEHVFLAVIPGRVAQSVARLTQEPEVPGSIPGPAHILSFLFPLIQEGQSSDTGESICTKH